MTRRYKLLPSPFMEITDLHGYIGPFWWINSQPSERQWIAGSYWELWGTFGIGRNNLRVAAAYQAGADMELKACCSVLENQLCCFVTEDLRTARRPKPPSLAEEALGAQQHLWDGGATHDDWHLVRRALERLQQLEDQQ